MVQLNRAPYLRICFWIPPGLKNIENVPFGSQWSARKGGAVPNCVSAYPDSPSFCRYFDISLPNILFLFPLCPQDQPYSIFRPFAFLDAAFTIIPTIQLYRDFFKNPIF